MKALLLIVNPQVSSTPPLAPTILMEDGDSVIVYSAGWGRRLGSCRLQTVTARDIREALQMPEADEVYLSAVREFPWEDPLSAEALAWTKHWWRHAAAELRRRTPAAAA